MKYSYINYENYEFTYAIYDNKLAYFGLKDKAMADIRKDFPNENLEYKEDLNPNFEKEIKDYFNGDLKEFKTPLYISGTDFQKSVYEYLIQVPYGKTVSYSDLANSLGDVKKVRAVGNAVGRNRHLIIMPCHRVLAKDGSLGGFSSGLDLKKILLKIEQ